MKPTPGKTPENQTLHASVIVCSYNRAQSLADTIDCLAKQELPDSIEWEVIIVDNNSSDDTRKVVESAQQDFAQLKYEFEGQQGLSHARNHGIASACGDIILFTDDDVCPEADWIQQTLQGMDTYKCDACGGYIAPVWEVPPPSWLTQRFHGFLAIKMHSTEPYEISVKTDTPFGANMAFKKEIFADLGLFDTTRGRKGNVLASGEDGELFQRLLDHSYKVMYLPKAQVHHRVEAFRVKKQYFRRWRYQTSLNIVQSRGMPGKKRIFGVPLYIFPQTIRAILRAVAGKFTLPPDEAFYREIIVWHFFGTIVGLIKSWRNDKEMS